MPTCSKRMINLRDYTSVNIRMPLVAPFLLPDRAPVRRTKSPNQLFGARRARSHLSPCAKKPGREAGQGSQDPSPLQQADVVIEVTRGPGLRTWGTAQRDVALKKHPKKLTLTPVVPGVAFAPHAAILRTNRADEARQHAGEQRPLARRVVHGLPPRNDARRDGMAGSRSGAGVRAADGVHALRDH